MDSRISRRSLLRHSGCGFGYLALVGLANQTRANDLAARTSAGSHPLAAREPHFPARAKRVIMLFMQGGPSHIDTFDYKPELDALAAVQQPGNRQGQLMPSPWKFHSHGESGLPISEVLPELSRHADDLCLINSMHTDNPAHPQATIMWHTGSINFVRPSMGSWVVYGLGSENENLPGFITIDPVDNLGGTQNYGSAFLPASFQGTRVTSGREPIANIRGERTATRRQRRHLDLIQVMNRELLRSTQRDAELEGVIESFELAFRMQSEVPQLMDISDESESTRAMYGIGEPKSNAFGLQCLMARRMAEAGVRFIQVTQRGWDHHGGLRQNLPNSCRAIDKPIAGLISDLKQRGLLRDTLLVWCGEFGRTPNEQNNHNGRRHNHRGFTAWMAGGGVRGGLRYGATDPTGLEAVEQKVHTHDLHATILHLLGLDHERLTYRYSGRDFRLTDVYGSVIDGIIA